MMKLQNWSIIFGGDDYTAPELQSQQAIGHVYGHPTRPDGDHIRTSRIIEINLKKRYIRTYSGSKYYLGTMNPEYAKFRRNLKKKGK